MNQNSLGTSSSFTRQSNNKFSPPFEGGVPRRGEVVDFFNIMVFELDIELFLM